MLTSRRAVSLALVSALLGAGATLLVVKHPFTDEGGLRLLGSHGPGRADSGVPPGWSHGDKTGWRGGSVPPGWAKHDRSASKQHDPDDHGKSEDRGGPKDKRDHDHHGPKPGQGKPGH
jgi:hypothetical protein